MFTLGAREGLKLEFKRAEVLDDPVNVAREAAAMLNSEGGEIWIGVTEEDGVARTIQRIAEPEAARRRLADALLARLEPSPTDDEVRVETRDGLLRVMVARGERGPYAFLERAMRGYVLRVDARVRQLEREELRTRFAGSRKAPPDRAHQTLAHWRGPGRKAADGAPPGLFVFIAPSAPIGLTLRSPDLEQLLRTPEASGNRRLGWNFSGQFHQLQRKAGNAVWQADHPAHGLQLTKDGDLIFSVPLGRLQWQGGPREIYPWALVEFVLSVCRLYPRLVQTCASAPPTEVLIAASVRGVSGWTLKPFSPNSVGYQLTAAGTAEADIEPEALAVEFSELVATPDRCGWRLLEQVYDHFGFGEAQMPPEYNRATSQFVIPS